MRDSSTVVSDSLVVLHIFIWVWFRVMVLETTHVNLLRYPEVPLPPTPLFLSNTCFLGFPHTFPYIVLSFIQTRKIVVVPHRSITSYGSLKTTSFLRLDLKIWIGLTVFNYDLFYKNVFMGMIKWLPTEGSFTFSFSSFSFYLKSFFFLL